MTRHGLPAAAGTGGPDEFPRSWWGDAWVRALEENAPDPARLSRGRGYARRGFVDAITVTPGHVTAAVHGTRPRPYRTALRLQVLTDAEWNDFLDAVSAEPAHIAALLDKDMPQALVAAADRAGVQLLPGPGDMDPSCSCPDVGRPCKHAAALCYETARLLDTDPFVLLLLRGREESELLDALTRRNAARAAREKAAGTPAATAAVVAREALSGTARPPLPAPLAAPTAAAYPPAFPEPAGAPSAEALEFLALDAAARAQAYLADGADPFAVRSAWQDAVRLAATHPHLSGRQSFSARFAQLAASTGRTAQELSRAVAAWRQGGAEGLAVLDHLWDPPAGDFDRARSALAAADFPRMTIRHNRLTDPRGFVQLRYGRDGRWYPYRSDGGREDWWPEGPADEDPVGALTGSLYG
ncbi:SWIM zinc finger family protein [Streptomyces sp. NPDC001922]|uniref:SWIM zinc finger family protein n=1 Tax=Streptomyces sp. NPDC001922 TaxID=3364624 RepID=UPI0036C6B5C2